MGRPIQAAGEVALREGYAAERAGIIEAQAKMAVGIMATG
jgi:hypothetical protein